MPLLETTGSASAKALGLNSASGPVNYIEDVFSTYLYVGNGATQTITNGIDLAGKGGLIWAKIRSTTQNHILTDTARGLNAQLNTNAATSGTSSTTAVTAFGSTGFTTGTALNTSSATYVTWTFRRQAKFFDIVTWTGDGTANRSLAHALGSVPGCIIVKNTTSGNVENWKVYHRSLPTSPNIATMELNLTSVYATGTNYWGTGPTSTNFIVNSSLNTS